MTQLVNLLVGIAAIIGAAAWIPQITKWLAKPKLQILSAANLGVSFTPNGVSVHWIISISTERQDALITKVGLIVTHQNGDRRFLEWGSLEEEIFKLTSVEINSPINYKKNSGVFAIKAITSALTERSIFFYDRDFMMGGRSKTAIASEHYTYLKGQEENAAELMVKSKEFKQALEFYTKDIFWKEGDYEIKLILTISNKKSPHVQNFSFALSKEDIAVLHENLDMFEPFLRKTILDSDVKFEWRYVFPNVDAVS